MKKEVLLTYGITNDYIDKLANVLIGLKRHSKKFWDNIIIFHDGICEKEQKNINKILKCEFVKVEEPKFIEKINEESMKTYSIASFFRYECFNYLTKYKTIIWSDVDVLYQKDLSDILEYAEKYEISAVKALDSFKVIDNLYDFINDYNMFVPMYNSGLLIFTDKLLKYGDLAKYCYEKTLKYAHILKWADQAIINFLIQDFNINVGNIDIDKYCLHPNFFKKSKNASIIHAYGTRKFWNDEKYNKFYSEWNINNEIWSEMIADDLPLVSVIMSIYDRIDFVDASINSIINQTYSRWELIIVVEKSENQNKIKNYLKKFSDKRIKIICNKIKLGFPESLNVAIENSNGKYIARMDDDDISIFNRLEKEVKYLEKNPDIGLVCTNAEFFMNAHGVFFEKEMKHEEIKAELLVGSPICHPSVMIRKDLFSKVKYNNNYFSEDYELWSQLIKLTKFYRMKDVLLKYRASNTGLTSISSNNEEKISNSTKNTIKHQLLENLNLNFGDNEISLIQKRRNVLENNNCYDSCLEYKKKVVKQIIRSNEKYKYYKDEYLKKALNYYDLFNENNNFKSNLKKIIKKILYPLYYPLKKIYIKVSWKDFEKIYEKQNYLAWEINNIKKDIHKLTKKGKRH